MKTRVTPAQIVEAVVGFGQSEIDMLGSVLDELGVMLEAAMGLDENSAVHSALLLARRRTEKVYDVLEDQAICKQKRIELATGTKGEADPEAAMVADALGYAAPSALPTLLREAHVLLVSAIGRVAVPIVGEWPAGLADLLELALARLDVARTLLDARLAQEHAFEQAAAE